MEKVFIQGGHVALGFVRVIIIFKQSQRKESRERERKINEIVPFFALLSYVACGIVL